MTVLSLFSGIGGLDLGLERAGLRVVAQCEADPFCREVLAKNFVGVPCFEDITTFDPAPWVGRVDCVCGGFPCQDVSVAGKGVGVEYGARSGLWREMRRVIAVVRPRWVIAENVPALRTRGADLVLNDLERLGYTATPLVVGAEHVGAPHRRHRVFIVAYAGGHGRDQRADQMRFGGSGELADTERGGQRTAIGNDDAREPDVARCGAGVADAQRDGRGAGCGVEGDEGRAGSGRRQSARGGERGEQLADAPGGGLGADGIAREGGGHADERGAVGHADGDGRRQHEPGRGPQGRTPARWPSPPGHPQHDWEAPRLVELPLGGLVDGVPARLVRFANRSALRAYGNAVVPQVAEVVGRAVMNAEERMGKERAA